MREFLELRVIEEHAGEVFAPNEGKRLGDSVRRVVLPLDDPKVPRILELQRSYKSRDDVFLTHWHLYRRYIRAELESAELFNLLVIPMFEPAGEECGTVYDESAACPHVFYSRTIEVQGRHFKIERRCGAGAKQVSDLVLDLRKVPKSKDIARTIAWTEVVVSQRLAELLVEGKMTGFELRPVRHKARYRDDAIKLELYPSGRDLIKRAEAQGVKYGTWGFDVRLNRCENREPADAVWQEHSEKMQTKELRRPPAFPRWYQLVVTSKPAAIAPPTRFGVWPSDKRPEQGVGCPSGHTTGLSLLSEITVPRPEWDGSDITETIQVVGWREGDLRPYPLLLISPRLWRLLRDNKIKGYKVEVAHLV